MSETSPNLARWLMVPAMIAVLVLVGLAVSSESRDEFSQRLENGSGGESDAGEQAGTTADEAPTGESFEFDPDGDFEGGVADPTTGDSGSGDGVGEGTGTGTGDGEGAGQGEEMASAVAQSNVDVRGEDGSVAVRIGPGADDLAFPRTAEGEPGVATRLRSDGLEPGEGLVLNPDAGIDVIDLDDIEPGQIVLDGSPVDGVDLIRSDGTRVEIRTPAPGGPAELRITDVGADGTATPLEADGDGSIDVGDDISLQLPTGGEDTIPPQRFPVRIDWRLFLGWLVITFVGSLILAYEMWRRAPDIDIGEIFTPPPEVKVAGFVDFLAILRADPDPARAIRLAFEGAEKGLGTLPARTSTETPFEWHARVCDTRPHFDEALGSLCSHFTTARFAPSRPSSFDRDAAVADLERLAHLAGYHEVLGRPTDGIVGAPR
ncbi:MAG: hypothetical protein AAF962_06475 [Actinomycetota bacterium]